MAVLSYKGRELKAGQKVRVYKNLHNDKFSIMDYKSGKVVGHADFVLLEDVHFQVRKGGHSRARKEGIRNVHAFAVGFFVHAEENHPSTWDEFTYNPFQHEAFIDRFTGYQIHEASKVQMSKGKYLYIT